MQYLFNLFDFWGAVVTSRPEIKTLKDLEGKQLAGARATTNYVMFEFFAQASSASTCRSSRWSTPRRPGLVGYALADRADAVQIWEPAYTLLLAKKPDIRTLDIGIDQTWQAFAGGNRIPYLGVGAHADWADQNPALVAKLYATYKAAADWIVANPDEAAPLMAPGSTAEDLQGDGSADPQQRAARHEPRARQPRSARRSRPSTGRRRRRLFPGDAVGRHDLRQADPMIDNPRLVRALQATREHARRSWALWQIASLFFPRYLFPLGAGHRRPAPSASCSAGRCSRRCW